MCLDLLCSVATSADVTGWRAERDAIFDRLGVRRSAPAPWTASCAEGPGIVRAGPLGVA
jgi:hypothetical protein